MLRLWKIVGALETIWSLICPSERNKGLMVVVVDESSKSPLFDGNGQIMDDNEQVRGNEVAIEEP